MSETLGIVYHKTLVQGSLEWHMARCGLLTASEMHLIVTPTLKAASNDKERAHLFELLAQRITEYVPPRYIGEDMLRGHEDEERALIIYENHYGYGVVHRVGFVTNDKWGFTIGYSPDAIVGNNGLVECKSRNQKLQMRTLTEFVPTETIDPDFVIQVQTGLLVTERDWCDVVSFCGGLPMATVRVFPDKKIQDAILAAAAAFEGRLADKLATYRAVMSSTKARLIPTERKIYEEIY